MSDMTVNTTAYPRLSGGGGELYELQSGKKRVVIPCRCRCSGADLSDDMDTGIERSQSKLVKFHEQSCEHQKRISKLRDEWYEKELLYSPTVSVSYPANLEGHCNVHVTHYCSSKLKKFSFTVKLNVKLINITA